MEPLPTTVDFPATLAGERTRDTWHVVVDGVALKLTNLDKLYWEPEGYTKGDLVTYYANIAEVILPYLRDRPLTMKRMPNGADGDFFYMKQAPDHTPDWVARAPVRSLDSGKTIDYLLAQDRPSLLYLANLGCIELHPWHSRVDDIGHPDYAFFDLDPFDVDFATVRHVALLVHTALERLGLRHYARTSGATGMQVYVPIDRVHRAAQVREWVGRVCRLINRADPERTTMEWSIGARSGKVFLDHGMNTEGKNIAATYSLRPERKAPVATPLTWDEVASDVEPQDFTIETIWQRLAEVGDLFAPVLQGGQDLRAAMAAVGMDPDAPGDQGHVVERPPRRARPPRARRPAAEAAEAAAPQEDALRDYRAKRDFSVTSEPSPDTPAPDEDAGPRFVIQHHLATRLHHDVRFERDGVLPSFAVPKGLPDVPGVRHLAVRTEDHPLAYLTFEGEIPAGEYGGGPVRIWDSGTYEPLEWTDDKVTVRLHGRRHHGEFHFFRTGGSGAGGDPKQWMVIRRDVEPTLPGPPPRLSPMLASDGGSEAFDDPDWRFEVKWDGVRAIATTIRPGAGDEGSTRLVSRQDNDITGGYPELASLWERVLARNAVLDGEIVAFGRDGRPSFQRLQQRMHVRGDAAVAKLAARVPVVYLVFDLLAIDGEPICDAPLDERRALLEKILVPGPSVQLSAQVAGDGIALYEATRAQGLEGIMAKRGDSRYRPGRRSRDWLKIKVRRSTEVVVGGWLPGEGGRSGRLGSLLVGFWDGSDPERPLRYAGRVGTGFDGAELERLAGVFAALARDRSPFVDAPAKGLPLREARWLEPRFVCTVEYGEITDTGRLRAGSYKGQRDDVPPEATSPAAA